MHPKNSGHQKAAESIAIAAAFFRGLGFQVTNPKDPSANGPDLTIFKTSGAFNVEVKSASISSRAWRIKKTLRIHDDYMAIVFPNGTVHVDTMSDHLSFCSGDGTRHLTKLGVLYAGS
jgi:hypothetical protein